MACKFSGGGSCLVVSHGKPCAGEVDDKVECPFWSIANSLIAMRKGL